MSLIDQLVLSIEVSGIRKNVDRSRKNFWTIRTNFAPGSGFPEWTQPTLRSKLSDGTYDQKGRASIQSNEYRFKGQAIETLGIQSKASVVLMNEQYRSDGKKDDHSYLQGRVLGKCRIHHQALT